MIEFITFYNLRHFSLQYINLHCHTIYIIFTDIDYKNRFLRRCASGNNLDVIGPGVTVHVAVHTHGAVPRLGLTILLPLLRVQVLQHALALALALHRTSTTRLRRTRRRLPQSTPIPFERLSTQHLA